MKSPVKTFYQLYTAILAGMYTKRGKIKRTKSLRTRIGKIRRTISFCKTILLATPLFFTPHTRQAVDQQEEYDAYVVSTAIDNYEELDALDADSPLDNSLEEKLGIRILGYPTEEDINAIDSFYSDPRNRQRMFLKYDVGLDRIVIFPPAMREHADYIGKTVFDRKEIQLFSGQVNNHGVAHHEFTHLGIHYLDENNYPFSKEWGAIAGSYNRVSERKEGRNKRYVYTNNEEKQDPLFGYITPYGGKSLEEDVATQVENVVVQPEAFGKVTESFEVYARKLELLFRYEFITAKEYQTAEKYLIEARLKP